MIRQVNSPSLVLLPPISVKVTGKAFIFRGVARRLMTVSVKPTAMAFLFGGVARPFMTVRPILSAPRQSTSNRELSNA